MPITSRSASPPRGGTVQRLAQRVERAGADVAVDDADRAEDELPEVEGGQIAGLDRAVGTHGPTLWRLRKSGAT